MRERLLVRRSRRGEGVRRGARGDGRSGSGVNWYGAAPLTAAKGGEFGVVYDWNAIDEIGVAPSERER